MSMPLHPINKAFFDAILTSDAVAVSDHAARIDFSAQHDPTERRSLDGPMLASEKTADWFCMAYPLPPDLCDALTEACSSLHASNPYFTALRNLLLIDEEGRITERGNWKLISAQSTSAAQAKMLGISYREIKGPAPRLSVDVPSLSGPGGRSSATEQRVFADWAVDGWQAVHDEGSTIAVLAKLAWLAHKKEVKALLPKSHYSFDRGGRHFCETLGFNFFWTIANNKLVSATDEARSVLLAIIGGITSRTLSVGFGVFKSEYEKNYSRPFDLELEPSLLMLQTLGRERISKMVDWLLRDPRLAGGWPDLTLFKGNEVRLVEAKKRDLLMFHQARSIELISRYMSPDLVTEVSLARVL